MSAGIRPFIPNAAISTFGIENPEGTFTLKWRNQFTGFTANGFDGEVQNGNYSLGGGTCDCGQTDQCTSSGNWLYRGGQAQVSNQGYLSKFWTGVPGEAVMSGAEYNVPTMVGPPGGVMKGSGDITAASGRNIFSYRSHYYEGDFETVADATCDIWDASKIHLHGADIPKPSAAPGGWGSALHGSEGVEPVFPMNMNNNDLQWKAQYSAAANVPGDASSTGCGAAQGPWYDNSEDVPGVVVEPQPDGSVLYKGISRSRVLYLTQRTAPGQVNAGVAFSMRLADPMPNGQLVGNWASKSKLHFNSATMTNFEELGNYVDDDSVWTSREASLSEQPAGEPLPPSPIIPDERTYQQGNGLIRPTSVLTRD